MKLPVWRWDDGGATYYQDTSALLWRRPGELVGRFYNVNVYNMYILLPSKNENFQIKNSDIFSYFCSKHRLRVFVRTASF